jgi:hypothetical protein
MSSIDVNQIQTIYNLLGDDISRDIFANRLMYSLTQDVRYIRNVVCTRDIGKTIYGKMKNVEKPLAIFGSGSVGKRLVNIYNDIKFECFIDNSHAGEYYNDMPIISLKNFIESYPDGVIIISTKLYFKEILEQLHVEGIVDDRIINLGMEYEKMNHSQYFDLPQLNMKMSKKEVFVDGGCYDGNTSVDFMNWCKKSNVGDYVYAWEPDSKNIIKMQGKS